MVYILCHSSVRGLGAYAMYIPKRIILHAQSQLQLFEFYSVLLFVPNFCLSSIEFLRLKSRLYIKMIRKWFVIWGAPLSYGRRKLEEHEKSVPAALGDSRE